MFSIFLFAKWVYILSTGPSVMFKAQTVEVFLYKAQHKKRTIVVAEVVLFPIRNVEMRKFISLILS